MVALARYYREQEDLTIAEIARRLGRSEATVKAYFDDPTGEKARAVKARYQGVCHRCGAPTAPQWQRRRPRLLQRLPPRRDRPQVDARAGTRSDARMEGPLRRAANLVQLVPNARKTAGRQRARKTARRRMAAAGHGHRPVRKLGGGESRRHLQLGAQHAYD